MDESTNDDVLAKQALSDVEAFAILYRHYVQRVYSYSLSRVGNPQDAQDLTAQTFLAAMQALDSYEPRGMFSAWLLGIARRKAADHYRDIQMDVPIKDVELIPEPVDAVDEAIIERLQMEEVASLLAKLNPERAEALRLRYFGELKLREIAQVMDKSEGAVKMLVARALDDLRKMLIIREETR
jgi:RNA polymerase sigma-70 factor, ECF subfamily